MSTIKSTPRLRWSFPALLWLLAPTIAHGACVGPAGAPRHPTVTAEYASSKSVILGQLTHTRNISSPDDPDGFDWTVYEVKVLTVYKGRPPKLIKLVSPNTSSRFPMDDGRDYLLFIEHSSKPERAGKELLPANFVDECGNSGLISERSAEIRSIRSLSNQTRP